jgi:hypothetical protein
LNKTDRKSGLGHKQGQNIKAVYEAAKKLGLVEGPLSKEDKVAILKEAGMPLKGNLSTAGAYRSHGRRIDAAVGIDAFIRSDWDTTRHQQEFAALCEFQPAWAKVVFGWDYPKTGKGHSSYNRMAYETLQKLVVFAEIQAAHPDIVLTPPHGLKGIVARIRAELSAS